MKGRDNKRFVARSSVTGHFVSLWYAIRHPRTTTIERRRRSKGGGAPTG